MGASAGRDGFLQNLAPFGDGPACGRRSFEQPHLFQSFAEFEIFVFKLGRLLLSQRGPVAQLGHQ